MFSWSECSFRKPQTRGLVQSGAVGLLILLWKPLQYVLRCVNWEGAWCQEPQHRMSAHDCFHVHLVSCAANVVESKMGARSRAQCSSRKAAVGSMNAYISGAEKLNAVFGAPFVKLLSCCSISRSMPWVAQRCPHTKPDSQQGEWQSNAYCDCSESLLTPERIATQGATPCRKRR